MVTGSYPDDDLHALLVDGPSLMSNVRQPVGS